MNYTENYKGIKLDVQAVDISIDDSVQETIRKIVDKLLKHTASVNFADVYLKVEHPNPPGNKYVSVRLGIPGPDVFADERGDHFEPMLKEVAEKLIRQLEKAK